MSCATAVPTGFTQADVYDYARHVRLHLSDLGPNVVSDLTGGLEADLTESLAEREPSASGGLAAVFGTPESYADELRASAGLPLASSDYAVGAVGEPDGSVRRRLPRLWGLKLLGLLAVAVVLFFAIAAAASYAGPGGLLVTLLVIAGLGVGAWTWWRRRRAIAVGQVGSRTSFSGMTTRVRDGWNTAWQPITSTPTWQRFRAWCEELAPLWWALRGWIIGSFIATVFERGSAQLVPATFGGFVFALAMTVLSIQWGRGRWLPWRWLPKLATVLSVAAVLLAIPMYANSHASNPFLGYQDDSWQRGFDDGLAAGQQDGVRVDGQPVTNIFAFDAEGNPIPAVQLFDERGRPITLGPTEPGGSWVDNSIAIDQNGQRWYNLPRNAGDGRELWNTFPLYSVRETDVDFDNAWDSAAPILLPGRTPLSPQWPFLRSAATVEVAPDAGPVAESDNGTTVVPREYPVETAVPPYAE